MRTHLIQMMAVALAIMLAGTIGAGCAMVKRPDLTKPWPQWAQDTIERTKAGGGGDGGGTGN